MQNSKEIIKRARNIYRINLMRDIILYFYGTLIYFIISIIIITIYLYSNMYNQIGKKTFSPNSKEFIDYQQKLDTCDVWYGNGKK